MEFIAYGDQDAKVTRICFCGHSEESHSVHPTGTAYCNACADDYEAHDVIPWHEFHEAA